jgi:hypothetical protein
VDCWQSEAHSHPCPQPGEQIHVQTPSYSALACLRISTLASKRDRLAKSYAVTR